MTCNEMCGVREVRDPHHRRRRDLRCHDHHLIPRCVLMFCGCFAVRQRRERVSASEMKWKRMMTKRYYYCVYGG